MITPPCSPFKFASDSFPDYDEFITKKQALARRGGVERKRVEGYGSGPCWMEEAIDTPRRAHRLILNQYTQALMTEPMVSKHYDVADSDDTYYEQAFIEMKTIGTGSFGSVYKALWREDYRVYAVKESILPYKTEGDRTRKRKEVEKLFRFSHHPNMVQFYGAWEEKGRLFIQMELHDVNLTSYCKYYVPTHAECWSFFYDVLHGVHYLHSRNIIHMDIKPDNILLSTDKVCKLADFGIAHDLTTGSSDWEDGDSRYMALEVMQDRVSKAADIFSMGITFLEVCTNVELPKSGRLWHALRDGQLPASLTQDVDPSLLVIIRRMMACSVDERPTSEELTQQLGIHFTLTCRVLCMKSTVWNALYALGGWLTWLRKLNYYARRKWRDITFQVASRAR